MTRNTVYIEILADLTPMPEFIEYVRQCFKFNFSFESEDDYVK